MEFVDEIETRLDRDAAVAVHGAAQATLEQTQWQREGNGRPGDASPAAALGVLLPGEGFSQRRACDRRQCPDLSPHCRTSFGLHV
jgi:hypothetical protein